jgi:hypothetical protein
MGCFDGVAAFIWFGSIKIYLKMYHYSAWGSMWYNELLVVLMAFVVVLMIVMAIVVSNQRRRPVVEEKAEEKVEKIFVEKGFENHVSEPVEEPDFEEEMNYTPVYIEEEPAEPEAEEPESVYIEEPEPVLEQEPVLEEPTVEAEPVHDEGVEITPVEPIILESEYVEPVYDKFESVLVESEPVVDELEYEKIVESAPVELEPEPEYVEPVYEKIVESAPMELEPEAEPEYYDPVSYFIPDATEIDEDVVITPNQTFYDPVPEEAVVKVKPVIEKSPALEEAVEPVERRIDDIPEVELSPQEPDVATPIPEEIEPDVEEEPVPEPVVKPRARSRSRTRKPVIDESDPELKIDLGVETCPHCGSKVPNTIYCIYCGKSLDPTRVVEQE